jgi:hypothetical protein
MIMKHSELLEKFEVLLTLLGFSDYDCNLDKVLMNYDHAVILPNVLYKAKISRDVINWDTSDVTLIYSTSSLYGPSYYVNLVDQLVTKKVITDLKDIELIKKFKVSVYSKLKKKI